MTDTSKEAVIKMIETLVSDNADFDDVIDVVNDLSAQLAAANARADAAEKAARDKALLEAAERFPDGRQPWPPNAIRKAVLALRDKPAPWRCPECNCASFSFCDEAQADGTFAKGSYRRCHDCKFIDPQLNKPAPGVTVHDQIEGVLAKMGRAAASTEGSWAAKGATISPASVWEWINELRAIAGGGDE